ncbi:MULTISPECIES: SH3 domain-containing protein [unclassified Streptomyces]|uniref:SH3 domain-containing protein n=1 Tax=unclassified Streptomyces TaxID=2593676 RepID=UPI002E338D1D|nr:MULTISPECIES: SH3 domain-containing protein [unclassified Streptomyces]
MAVERMESTDSVASTENRNGETATATADTDVARLVTYPIAPGSVLNVRSGPGTGYRIVRVLSEGSRVPIFCQTPGQSVSGPYGTTSIWDNIANGEYVSDAYVKTGSDGYIAPRCS